MMRAWVQVGLCVLLVCGVLAAGPVAAQGDGDSDAPYIYYYSYAHNAFVIERADGTDTRLLGEDVTDLVVDDEEGPPVTVGVDGPGWSPSGQWFAWIRTLQFEGYTWRSRAVYILSVDGQRRLTLLDDIGFDYVQAVWAKDEDLLFVAGQSIEYAAGEQLRAANGVMHRYMVLIDTSANKAVAEYTDSVSFAYPDLAYIPLSPVVFQTYSEKTFFAQFYNNGGNSVPGSLSLYRLNGLGDATGQRINRIYVSTMPGYEAPSFTYSSQGWITYVPFTADAPDGEGRIVLENTVTGETAAIDGCGTYANWPEDQNLRLWGQKECQVDVKTKRWRVFDGFAPFNDGAWSPDKLTYVELWRSSEYLDLVVQDFHTNPGTVTTISAPDVDVSEQPFAIRFADWIWSTNRHGILRVKPLTYVLDLQTYMFEPIIGLPYYTAHTVELSPSERYVLTMLQGVVVYDTMRNTLGFIRPAYDSWQTPWGGKWFLDSAEQWLLIFENANAAVGNVCCSVGVSRIDGTQRRDLIFAQNPSESMYTWLPLQVDPADLPPVLSEPLDPRPTKVLHGHEWAQFISWSPDGRFIAVVAYRDEENAPFNPHLTIRDVVTEMIVEQHDLPPGSTWVEWNADGVGGYVLETRSGDRDRVQCTTAPVVAVPEFDAESASLDGFYAQSLSPDGHWCATGSASGGAIDPEVVLWDATTWEPVITLPNSALALAFSPDGTQLAVAVSWDVQIWDVADLLAWGAEQP